MRRRHKRPAGKPQTIDFEIDHIDPMGQGVSKLDGNITFIKGVLPGETGQAEVYKRAKGVRFASLKHLDATATNRIEAVCPHFERCPGCQYLHTDYDSELMYKREALGRHLAGLGIDTDDIEVVRAPRRLSYRNRVQLHYRHKYIGMLDSINNEVLEIPGCRILREELQAAFDELQTGKWTGSHSGHGHCELYYRSGQVSVEWDRDYAHGGFSQVYEEMNQALKQQVQDQLRKLGTQRLLDLFSGSGNLSEGFAAAGGERVLIDSFAGGQSGNLPQGFEQMDLYDERSLANLVRKSNSGNFDAVLLDPPRRGFPALDLWVKKIKPLHLLYVSCNPASLARDLGNLKGRFRIKTVQLLDLFPATSHFETLLVLEFIKPAR